MQTKTKKALEWITFSFIGLVAILAASLFYYQVAYANKIYNNVYFADTDLSKKTKSQVKEIVENQNKKVLDQEFTIKNENGEVKTKLNDTGLSFDTSETVNDCYAIGRSDNFFDQLVRSFLTLFKKQNISAEAKINQEQYSNFLTNIVSRLNSDPQNASIAIEKGEIKVISETNGKVIDTSNLSKEILKIASKKNQNTVTLASKIKEPDVKAADFTEARNYAESLINKNITLTYNDKVYKPTKEQIGLWINFAESKGVYSASLNENNVTAYLNNIAKNFEIAEKAKKINGNDESVIEEGQPGVYLNKPDAINQIKNQINSDSIKVILNTYTKDPKIVKVYPAEGIVTGRFDGKYIDVDLTQQKLCRIDGSELVDCFTISSGKASMPTPTGTFYIQNKNSRQWSATYGLWMPWWQAFSGSYGIHELPEWPNGYKEGENHLGTPVSHGCVRLGIGSAETVFNWTEVGTPVYIHK